VRQVRTEAPRAPEEQREAILRDHLQQVHKRALAALEGWSGPFASEEGEYYHNDVLQVSTWECPVTSWENELAIRHTVLCRCLLPEQMARSGHSETSPTDLAVPSSSHGHLLPSLRLPLSLIRRESVSNQPGTPSTSRSFHTARSTARSGGSSRSKKSSVRSAEEHAQRRKERQERRAAKEAKERRRQEALESEASTQPPLL
jgi:hypothetical protein